MGSNTKQPSYNSQQAQPFDSVEEAWFWFIQAHQARQDGARFTAGLALIPRPCEPNDFLKIMNRLYINRRLTMDHFKVLKHYGVRLLPPDPARPKELHAYNLWREALGRLKGPLERKGIVREDSDYFMRDPDKDWAQHVLVFENTYPQQIIERDGSEAHV